MRPYQLPVVLLLVLFFLWTSATETAKQCDEGFAVYNAERVMDGDLPYRDFRANYAPAQFYTLAWLFRAFGPSLTVSRSFDTLLRFLIALLIYFYARKLVAQEWALVALALAALLLGTNGYYGYAMIPALLLSLASALCLLRFIGGGPALWLVAAGFGTGVVELYRQDIGAYTAACLGFILLLFTYTRETSHRFQRLLKHEAIYVSSMCLVIVPVCLYFVSAGGWKDLWYDLFVFPGTVLHAIRSLPFPSLFLNPFPLSELQWNALEWIRFYFPLIVYAGVFFQAAFTWKRSLSSGRLGMEFYATVLLAILGMMFFAQAWSRNDPVHLLPTTIVALVLTVKLLSGYEFVNRPLWIKATSALAIVVLLWIYVGIPVRKWRRVGSIYSLTGCQSPNGRAGCVPVEPAQARAIQYVQSLVPPGGKIYSGSARHDQVFSNDMLFYFLSGHHSGTRFHEVVPRLTNTLQVQERIVKDLIQEKVRCLVLYSGFDKFKEPNASRENSGVTYLDNFIHSNFQPVQKFDNYTVWTSKIH